MKQITEFLGWDDSADYTVKLAINDIVMRDMGTIYAHYLRVVLRNCGEWPCPVDGSRTSAILAATDEQLEDAMGLLVVDPECLRGVKTEQL